MSVKPTNIVDLFQDQEQLIPYVSTDLRLLEQPVSDSYRQDIIRDGVTFRRLDADYFVWIEQTVAQIQKAYAQDRIPQRAYSVLMSRYRIIQKWIEANVTPKNLNAARKRSTLATFNPPPAARPASAQPKSNADSPSKSAPHQYPAEGFWEHTVPIDPEVIKLVDSIRDEAIAKGWTEAALYQNRGHYPAGKCYGLICILDKTDRIEKIDEQFIYIRTFKGAAVPSEGEIVEFPNLNYRSDKEEQRG